MLLTIDIKLLLLSIIDNMKEANKELIHGTLDLLILKVLATAEMHGWDISKRIMVISKNSLLIKQGSLYPAVHRLEQKRLIEADWGVSDLGRRAKFYRLTKKGRQQLKAERSRWNDFVESISLVLGMEEREG